MEQKTIRLHPFQDRTAVELDITCTISRQSHLLQIDFRLQGDLNAVAIPPLVKRPARRHQLWKNTCLEFFLAASLLKLFSF